MTQNCFRCHEKGSYLLLASLVMVAFVFMLALAIDSSRFLTSRSEKVFTADHVATAVLHTYLDSEPTDTATPVERHAYKVAQAINRAAEIGGANSSAFVSDNHGNMAHVRSVSDLAFDETGVRGTLTFGRWWVEKPLNCSDTPETQVAACPCSTGTFRACFQECDANMGCIDPDGSSTLPFASAVKVTLRTDEEAGVKAIFGQAVSSLVSVQVSGTSLAAQSSLAAALPKHGVILFDLSRSASIDNYLPFEKGNVAEASEPAYLLTGNPGSCTYLGAAPGSGLIANVPALTSAPAVTLDSNYSSVYLNGERPPAGYGCVPVVRTGGTEYYAINKSGGTTNLETSTLPFQPDDPQPYTQLLAGLNAFLRKAQELANPADRFTLIGYDREIFDERIYPSSTDPFVGIADTARFSSLISMTKTRQAAAEAGLFSRATARIGGSVVPNYGDLPMALNYAYKLLTSQRGIDYVDPYIIVFSNGLTNVEAYGSTGPRRAGRYTVPAKDLPGNKSYLQQRQYASLMESIFTQGDELLKRNRIRVHVVASGRRTGAHRIEVRKGDGTCFTDYELRALGLVTSLPSVSADGAALRNQYDELGAAVNPNGPYRVPMSELFRLANVTFGDWSYVLPPCTTFTSDELTAACAGPAVNLGTGTPALKTATGAKATLTARPGEVDDDGRVLCNPLDGENPIKNALSPMLATLSETLEKRPIVLVAPLINEAP